MDTTKICSGSCAVARGLARAGDAWSMLILRDAGLGLRRFDQFQKSLGIAPNILARRLSALTADGLLARRQYSERPPRYDYVLTECGRDYLPVLQAIGAWGRAHFGDATVTRLVDAESGAAIEPIVVDRATGRPLRDVAVRVAPPA